MSGAAAQAAPARPRLGFCGVGWIGRHRMEAVLDSGAATAAAIADPVDDVLRTAAEVAPGAELVSTLDDLLALELDGVVIATPSALHAEQAVAALERGVAVFCQKPLGRSAAETARVVAAARQSDRPLGVDLSYRYTEAMASIAALIRAGDLGDIHAVHLVFHNAYGPDKPWFYRRSEAGGGCVMDLGIHLVDLALWTLGFPAVRSVASRLTAGGAPLRAGDDCCEDYAAVQLELDSGAVVQLACSWRLPAGRDAVIEAAFYGTAGGAAMRNVDGSFYDFVAERYDGTRTTTLVAPPDAWGGRAAVAWARQVAAGEGFDPGSERLVGVAEVLDAIYARGVVPRCGY